MFGGLEQIRAIAGPLVTAEAFVRLGRITFLGVLSPRYRTLPKFPFAHIGKIYDGSRAQHSLGVASIVLRMTSILALSLRAQRYAAAWALSHDLATWPLSHTGEAGFSQVTEINSRHLRRGMIEGANWLPRRLTVISQLREMQIEPDLLLALTEKDDSSLDLELRILQRLIHSPITPDSIEGMARSGAVFGVPVPRPEELIAALYRDVFSDVVVDRKRSSNILRFWRNKGQIYERHINLWRSIEFESSWSRSIEDAYRRISAVDSLLLSERELIYTVLSKGVPRFREVRRYKHPLIYATSPELDQKRLLRRDTRVEDLRKLLVKVERQL
jgi:hypothetical protein